MNKKTSGRMIPMNRRFLQLFAEGLSDSFKMGYIRGTSGIRLPCTFWKIGI